MTETELHKIIEACKANDHKAFEVVYKKYYRVLLGIAMRYTSDEAGGEDVLQDSFIKIFHNIHSFNGSGSFEGWLKRIVQNTAINHYRKNLKYDLYVDISDHEDKIEDEGMNSIFDAFEVKDIIALLNKLPHGYRLAINLYFIDGYSHNEIADMLNITPGTSKSQVFKAKNYLKALIESSNKERSG